MDLTSKFHSESTLNQGSKHLTNTGNNPTPQFANRKRRQVVIGTGNNTTVELDKLVKKSSK
jgi:hypothetical protein